MKVSKVFNTLTLKQFWKTKTFFKKTGIHFLVEATKIEYTSFPFKTALSEANVKTNIEWRPQNGPITKSGVLPVTTYFIGKIFPVLEPLKKS